MLQDKFMSLGSTGGRYYIWRTNRIAQEIRQDISAQRWHISWRWFINIPNESTKRRVAGMRRSLLTVCSLSPSSRNLTSRFLFAVCQRQVAPTAAWAEAWGERSLLVASIPDLQKSFCHCPMSCCCCCSVLSFTVGGGTYLVSCHTPSGL